ncbi:hypothetical protein [Pseudonocardia spirodelae]|uniref:Calcium-binding protein n=1 Tax=Pseudonocardia spirodelae TaxID=3133431 RepID=A0ABU8T9T9_9PSEU
MSRAVGRRRLVLALVVGVVLVASAAWGTWAAFTAGGGGPAGTASAATVVLGGRSAPPALDLGVPLAGGTATATLSIDYRGSVPATASVAFPATTATGCVSSPAGLTDGPTVGSLTVRLGSRAPEPWCRLLDGVPRPVATLVPGTVTTVPVSATVGTTLLAARTESATMRVSAAGGFTDTVTGSLRLSTRLLPAVTPRAQARVASPTVVAVSAPPPPAECTAAGLTTFAETVVLSADAPSFDAARDRPGSNGPFLIVGTDGADTIVGSPGRDCVRAAGGDDVVDGGGGDDVLVGGTGDDRLTGGDGADGLHGGVGADTLLGGPENPAAPDVLDGGPDGGTCPDPGPEDTVSACTVPVPGTAPAAPATPAAPGAVGEGSADPTSPVSPAPATTTPVVPTTVPATPTVPGAVGGVP